MGNCANACIKKQICPDQNGNGWFWRRDTIIYDTYEYTIKVCIDYYNNDHNIIISTHPNRLGWVDGWMDGYGLNCKDRPLI